MKYLNHGSTIQISNKSYKVEYQKTMLLKNWVVLDKDKAKVYKSELDRRLSHKTVLKKWLTDHSKKQIIKRVEVLAERHGFEYNRVAVKDQRTRWGSCSSKRNLNFNWKLILAPAKCMDYVIVHELAHLKQMNHSKKFWDLVESCMPNYQIWEKWLKVEGRNLF